MITTIPPDPKSEEKDVRWPMTTTGTSLIGLVKNVASVQLGYFGEVFDRPSGRDLPWYADDAEANADLWATATPAMTTATCPTSG